MIQMTKQEIIEMIHRAGFEVIEREIRFITEFRG
jgi:hypothetical protein